MLFVSSPGATHILVCVYLGPGDLEDVKDQLQGVVQIQRTDAAFAAILLDGGVIAWGAAEMLDIGEFGGISVYIYIYICICT